VLPHSSESLKSARGYNTPAPLKGLLFGPDNRAFTPAYTRRGNRLYRYYVSTGVIKRGPEACVIRRVPAAEIEAAIIDQVRALVRTPEIIGGHGKRHAAMTAASLRTRSARRSPSSMRFGTSSSRPSRHASSNFWSNV
jgi:hypothetical protein